MSASVSPQGPPAADLRAVAERAFAHLVHGLATGEWHAWFACLTDDVELWFPMGRFKGVTRGREAVEAFFHHVRTAYPGGLFVTLDRVLTGETSVAFEFRDRGLLYGKPYANRVIIVLDVRDGRISAYREYFGSDGTP